MIVENFMIKHALIILILLYGDLVDLFRRCCGVREIYSFEISGTTLKLKDMVSANYETKSSYAVTLTATDSGSNSKAQDFTISVTDVNETPSAVALSPSSFAENAAGATIGTLSTTDPDSDETFTYALSGTDNDSFELSGTT